MKRKQKAVGFRTLSLVSLGSAVFTMVGHALDHRTPISAQVVSGIGFLGAGVILRGPYGITGLTSAATIWTMAAVGMTVGIGYGGAGLLLSCFLLAAMLVISVGEQRYIGSCRYRWAVLTFRVGRRQEPHQNRGSSGRVPLPRRFARNVVRRADLHFCRPAGGRAPLHPVLRRASSSQRVSCLTSPGWPKSRTSAADRWMPASHRLCHKFLPAIHA